MINSNFKFYSNQQHIELVLGEHKDVRGGGLQTQYLRSGRHRVHVLQRRVALHPTAGKPVDKHVSVAVGQDSESCVGRADDEFPVCLRGLDVAQCIEAGTVAPADWPARLIRDGLPNKGVHIVAEANVFVATCITRRLDGE